MLYRSYFHRIQKLKVLVTMYRWKDKWSVWSSNDGILFSHRNKKFLKLTVVYASVNIKHKMIKKLTLLIWFFEMRSWKLSMNSWLMLIEFNCKTLWPWCRLFISVRVNYWFNVIDPISPFLLGGVLGSLSFEAIDPLCLSCFILFLLSF